MGNQPGKAQVQLVLDHSAIIAGGPISGTINFVLSQPVTNLTVVFRLTGKETSLVIAENATHRGKIKILNYTAVLYNTYNNTIRSGGYSIPFRINTPGFIPGTFEMSTRKYQGKIAYFVKARIYEQRNMIVKHKVPLIIKQAIDSRRMSMVGNAVVAISSCCFRAGECLIDVHFDKNAYLPDEKVKVSVSVDNSRSLKVMKRVKIEVYQVLTMISDSGVRSAREKKYFEREFKVSVPPRHRLMAEQALSFEIHLKKSKKTDLSKCSTTYGKIMRCDYQVRVSTGFGVFCSPGPRIDMPVLIYPHEIEVPQASAPEEWDPVEMPTVDLDMQNNPPQPDYYN